MTIYNQYLKAIANKRKAATIARVQHYEAIKARKNAVSSYKVGMQAQSMLLMEEAQRLERDAEVNDKLRLTNYLVAVDTATGQVVACCHIYACQINNQAHPLPYFMLERAQLRLYMANLVVLEGFRRQGIARMLLNTVFKLAYRYNKAIWLHVRADNTPAVTMYKNAGFRIVRTERRTNPDDELYLMVKNAGSWARDRKARGKEAYEQLQAS